MQNTLTYRDILPLHVRYRDIQKVKKWSIFGFCRCRDNERDVTYRDKKWPKMGVFWQKVAKNVAFFFFFNFIFKKLLYFICPIYTPIY